MSQYTSFPEPKDDQNPFQVNILYIQEVISESCFSL